MPAESWKTSSLVKTLKGLLSDVERGGFILRDGSLIELANISSDPVDNFEVDDFELLQHVDKDIVALWHTHPSGGSNLSPDDWRVFVDWPGIQHIIVGDEVRFYGVKGRGVINMGGPAE